MYLAFTQGKPETVKLVLKYMGGLNNNQEEKFTISRLNDLLNRRNQTQPEQVEQTIQIIKIILESEPSLSAEQFFKDEIKRGGDLPYFKTLLQTLQDLGIDLNAPQDEEGNTFLHLDAMQGYSFKTLTLCENGAIPSLKIKNKKGQVPTDLMPRAHEALGLPRLLKSKGLIS